MEDPESHPVYKTWISLTKKGYASLSAAERVFWGVYLLDLEVYNGAFLQYFCNTEGSYTHELVGSLTAIGANETAARVGRFFSRVFPEGVPVDADDRRDLALRVEDDYERFRIDEEALTEWYCQDTEGLFDKLQRYAREHGFLVGSSEFP